MFSLPAILVYNKLDSELEKKTRNPRKNYMQIENNSIAHKENTTKILNIMSSTQTTKQKVFPSFLYKTQK